MVPRIDLFLRLKACTRKGGCVPDCPLFELRNNADSAVYGALVNLSDDEVENIELNVPCLRKGHR